MRPKLRPVSRVFFFFSLAIVVVVFFVRIAVVAVVLFVVKVRRCKV